MHRKKHFFKFYNAQTAEDLAIVQATISLTYKIINGNSCFECPLLKSLDKILQGYGLVFFCHEMLRARSC